MSARISFGRPSQAVSAPSNVPDALLAQASAQVSRTNGLLGRAGDATQESHEWVLPDQAVATGSLPLETHLTHVNASLVTQAGGSVNQRSRRRRGARNSERNVSVGNDGRLPWVPRPPTRAVVITTVETLPSTTLLATSGSVPSYAAAYFTIYQIGDVSAYTTLFEQYRITCIEVLIEPQITEVVGAGDPGEYISVVDIDDANTPTSYADLCSYSTAVQTRGTQQHYHRWVPGVAVAVYSGAFTSFAATDSMWLDCGSPTIQHYGLKAGAPVVPAGNVQAYTFQARLHVSWRGRH